MKTQSTISDSPLFVGFPRVAMTTPFFTMDRHLEGWSVKLEEEGQPVTYQIGVYSGTGLLTGSLTVDDAEVLVGLLAFTDFSESPRAHFGSLHALGSRIWGRGYNAPSILRLVYRLGRLKTTGIMRQVEGQKTAPIFTCLSEWDLSGYKEDGHWATWDPTELSMGPAKVPEIPYRAGSVVFSTAFKDWMAKALDVDASTFLGIRSKLGRALYLFLPSKSWPPGRFSQTRPRCIDLGELLEMLGAKVPAKRAARLRLFQREDRNFSVARELDGARLWCGQFRFEVEERPAPKDHRVRFWIEPTQGIFGEQGWLPLEDNRRKAQGGKLQSEWLIVGGSQERWHALVSASVNESMLEDELNALVEDGILTAAGAEKNRDSATLALKLLGDDALTRIRAVVRGRILEGAVDMRKTLRQPPGAFWMGCLKEAIRELAKNSGP